MPPPRRSPLPPLPEAIVKRNKDLWNASMAAGIPLMSPSELRHQRELGAYQVPRGMSPERAASLAPEGTFSEKRLPLLPRNIRIDPILNAISGVSGLLQPRLPRIEMPFLGGLVGIDTGQAELTPPGPPQAAPPPNVYGYADPSQVPSVDPDTIPYGHPARAALKTAQATGKKSDLEMAAEGLALLGTEEAKQSFNDYMDKTAVALGEAAGADPANIYINDPARLGEFTRILESGTQQLVNSGVEPNREQARNIMLTQIFTSMRWDRKPGIPITKNLEDINDDLVQQATRLLQASDIGSGDIDRMKGALAALELATTSPLQAAPGFENLPGVAQEAINFATSPAAISAAGTWAGPLARAAPGIKAGQTVLPKWTGHLMDPVLRDPTRTTSARFLGEMGLEGAFAVGEAGAGPEGLGLPGPLPLAAGLGTGVTGLGMIGAGRKGAGAAGRGIAATGRMARQNLADPLSGDYASNLLNEKLQDALLTEGRSANIKQRVLDERAAFEANLRLRPDYNPGTELWVPEQPRQLGLEDLELPVQTATGEGPGVRPTDPKLSITERSAPRPERGIFGSEFGEGRGVKEYDPLGSGRSEEVHAGETLANNFATGLRDPDQRLTEMLDPDTNRLLGEEYVRRLDIPTSEANIYVWKDSVYRKAKATPDVLDEAGRQAEEELALSKSPNSWLNWFSYIRHRSNVGAETKGIQRLEEEDFISTSMPYRGDTYLRLQEVHLRRHAETVPPQIRARTMASVLRQIAKLSEEWRAANTSGFAPSIHFFDERNRPKGDPRLDPRTDFKLAVLGRRNEPDIPGWERPSGRQPRPGYDPSEDVRIGETDLRTLADSLNPTYTAGIQTYERLWRTDPVTLFQALGGARELKTLLRVADDSRFLDMPIRGGGRRYNPEVLARYLDEMLPQYKREASHMLYQVYSIEDRLPRSTEGTRYLTPRDISTDDQLGTPAVRLQAFTGSRMMEPEETPGIKPGEALDDPSTFPFIAEGEELAIKLTGRLSPEEDLELRQLRPPMSEEDWARRTALIRKAGSKDYDPYPSTLEESYGPRGSERLLEQRVNPESEPWIPRGPHDPFARARYERRPTAFLFDATAESLARRIERGDLQNVKPVDLRMNVLGDVDVDDMGEVDDIARALTEDLEARPFTERDLKTLADEGVPDEDIPRAGDVDDNVVPGTWGVKAITHPVNTFEDFRTGLKANFPLAPDVQIDAAVRFFRARARFVTSTTRTNLTEEQWLRSTILGFNTDGLVEFDRTIFSTTGKSLAPGATVQGITVPVGIIDPSSGDPGRLSSVLTGLVNDLGRARGGLPQKQVGVDPLVDEAGRPIRVYMPVAEVAEHHFDQVETMWHELGHVIKNDIYDIDPQALLALEVWTGARVPDPTKYPAHIFRAFMHPEGKLKYETILRESRITRDRARDRSSVRFPHDPSRVDLSPAEIIDATRPSPGGMNLYDPRQAEHIRNVSQWSPEANEKFARGFVTWLADGRLPTDDPDLLRAFSHVARWLREVFISTIDMRRETTTGRYGLPWEIIVSPDDIPFHKRASREDVVPEEILNAYDTILSDRIPENVRKEWGTWTTSALASQASRRKILRRQEVLRYGALQPSFVQPSEMGSTGVTGYGDVVNFRALQIRMDPNMPMPDRSTALGRSEHRQVQTTLDEWARLERKGWNILPSDPPDQAPFVRFEEPWSQRTSENHFWETEGEVDNYEFRSRYMYADKTGWADADHRRFRELRESFERLGEITDAAVPLTDDEIARVYNYKAAKQEFSWRLETKEAQGFYPHVSETPPQNWAWSRTPGGREIEADALLKEYRRDRSGLPKAGVGHLVDRTELQMAKTPRRTNAAFEKRYIELAEKTGRAEKTPNRRMSPAEVALWKRDWKAYSRSRGYTEAEIKDEQAFINAYAEGRRLGYSDDELSGLAPAPESILGDDFGKAPPGTTVTIDGVETRLSPRRTAPQAFNEAQRRTWNRQERQLDSINRDMGPEGFSALKEARERLWKIQNIEPDDLVTRQLARVHFRDRTMLPTILFEEADEVLPEVRVKLLTAIRAQGKATARTLVLQQQRMRQRTAIAGSMLESGQATVPEALRATGGEMPKATTYESLLDKNIVTPADIELVHGWIATHPRMRVWTKINTYKAFAKLIDGENMTVFDIKRLRIIFGKELTSALFARRSRGQRYFFNFLEALGIPRALLATLDFSAVLRQGLLVAGGHPKQWAESLGPSIKGAISDKNFEAIHKTIEEDVYYDFMTGSAAGRRGWRGAAVVTKEGAIPKTGLGLEITDPYGGLSEREEAFMSNIFRSIPAWTDKKLGKKGKPLTWTLNAAGYPIRVSERAYVGFLNNLRFKYMKHILQGWEKQGLIPDADTIAREGIVALDPELQRDAIDMARWINIATGRGDVSFLQAIPGIGEGAQTVLNAAFFSPRLVAARFQAPLAIMDPRYSWRVRQHMARDMVGATTWGMGILALASYAGADVEHDPRSSDFGRIQVGNTRLDVWGGFQPVARVIARMSTGKGKSTGTEMIRDIDRSSEMLRFARTKLSPLAGLGTDIWQGETFTGEELMWGKTTLADQAFGRLTPLIIQDVMEAWEHDRWTGVAMAAPSFIGTSVISYQTVQEVARRDFKNPATGEDARFLDLPPFLQDYTHSLNTYETSERDESDFAKQLQGYDEEWHSTIIEILSSPTHTDSEKVSVYYQANTKRHNSRQAAFETKYGDEAFTEEGGGIVDRNTAALDEYHEMNRQAQTPGGRFDSDYWNNTLDALNAKWTRGQREWVAANTNELAPFIPDAMLELLPERTRNRLQASEDARKALVGKWAKTQKEVEAGLKEDVPAEEEVQAELEARQPEIQRAREQFSREANIPLPAPPDLTPPIQSRPQWLGAPR